jgi:alpha-L-fucosidase
MTYVNFVTRHHDSFALWDTKTTPFNSVIGAPARRDLVGEMAWACERHKLALFLYFSHGREWRHPARREQRPLGRGRPARVRPAGTHLCHRRCPQPADLSRLPDRANNGAFNRLRPDCRSLARRHHGSALGQDPEPVSAAPE